VDSLTPNQKFILDNPKIDTSTIRVTVRNSSNVSSSNKFTFADNLFNVNSSSKIFFIREIEDQRYELIFGDGIFGVSLINQNYIEVSYVITNNSTANGVSSFSFIGRLVDNNNNSVTSGVSVVTTNIASSVVKKLNQ
jgi:hypothetical protein